MRAERCSTASSCGSTAVEPKTPMQATEGSTSTGPKAPAVWSGYSREGEGLEHGPVQVGRLPGGEPEHLRRNPAHAGPSPPPPPLRYFDAHVKGRSGIVFSRRCHHFHGGRGRGLLRALERVDKALRAPDAGDEYVAARTVGGSPPPCTVSVEVPLTAAAMSSESSDLAVPGAPTSIRPRLVARVTRARSTSEGLPTKLAADAGVRVGVLSTQLGEFVGVAHFCGRALQVGRVRVAHCGHGGAHLAVMSVRSARISEAVTGSISPRWCGYVWLRQ